MSSNPPKQPANAPSVSEHWPEIDRLPADTLIRIPVGIGWYAGVKVVLDYGVAVVSLPFAAILVLLAALAVKLTSRGPVFYTQTRIGLNGLRFKIIKIRTMQHNCEATTGALWSQKGDNRITRIGKILRFTHIDELPQLWNVLRGEMSLVGPRPERPEVIQAKGLDHLVPGYKHRLRVKPGVTGLAQLQLPADTDVTSVRHKVVYDLYYVQNHSLWLDTRLLFGTLVKAFLSPKWLRRVFFLPNRKKVAEVFHEHVEPARATDPLSGLQPA